jgi:molybdate transport system permease protein
MFPAGLFKMERDPMSEIIEIVSNLDWSPLWISLKTGVVATFVCFFLGIFAARKVLKLGHKTRAVVDGILTLPMVLAPTVTGFFLLLLFSMRRPVGAFLYGNLGIKVVQTWLGCILAASIIAFPLMYRNARAAFEQVDTDLIYAARTLGMPEREIFWRVVMPAARPGIVSGAILTFARAIGEYGATSMLAGNIAGKTGTISQKIAMVIQNGDYATAGVWVVIMLVIAFVIVLAMNLVGSRGRNTEKRW